MPRACPEGHCSSQNSLGYWIKSLPTDVTLAAQKPLVLPVTDRARLKKLPHTMARKVLPMTHLMTCGMENLQPFQHLHKRLQSRSVLAALCCNVHCDGSRMSNCSQRHGHCLHVLLRSLFATNASRRKGIHLLWTLVAAAASCSWLTQTAKFLNGDAHFPLIQAQISNIKSLVFRQQQALLISMLSHMHQKQHMWPTSHALVSLHSNLRLVDSQLQADNLAYVRQACVDGVGVGHIVKDFLLPVLFIMCLLGLLAPELGNSRVLKCDTPAARGSLKSCAYAVWGFLGHVRMTMKYRCRPQTASQDCQTQWAQVVTYSALLDHSVNMNAAGWVK